MRLREARGWQRAVVCVLVAQFLAIVALAAAPHLHESLHHDADHGSHECAVTVMTSGGTDDSPAPVFLHLGSVPPDSGAALPELGPDQVAALFLSAHIFEHAPPARA